MIRRFVNLVVDDYSTNQAKSSETRQWFCWLIHLQTPITFAKVAPTLPLFLGVIDAFTHFTKDFRGGEGKTSTFFFEDIAVLENDVNRLSIRPLLRMTSTKALFSSKLVILTSYCTCRMRICTNFSPPWYLCIFRRISHLFTTLRNTDLGGVKYR